MTGGGLPIVIEGTREDWVGGVGGVRTLDRARPHPGPNGGFWFGGRARPRRRPGLVPARRGGHRSRRRYGRTEWILNPSAPLRWRHSLRNEGD